MRRSTWYSAISAFMIVLISNFVTADCMARQPGPVEESRRYLHDVRGGYVIPGSRRDPWGPYIREASRRLDVPGSWIRAVMKRGCCSNVHVAGLFHREHTF
jgi:hypothetical protein